MKLQTVVLSCLLAVSTVQAQPCAVQDIVIGKDNGSTGGGSTPQPTPTDPPPKGDGDSRLSIKSFRLSIAGKNNWEGTVEATLAYGGFIYVDGELELKNRSSRKTNEIDIDYRIDHGKNFDKEDSLAQEEDKEKIEAGKTIEKNMRGIKVQVSDDGTKVHVYQQKGAHVESFNVIDNKAKIYFFVDAKEEGGDRDISSTHSTHEEYGKVVITVMPRSYSHEDYKQSPCEQAGYTTPGECAAMLIANEIL